MKFHITPIVVLKRHSLCEQKYLNKKSSSEDSTTYVVRPSEITRQDKHMPRGQANQVDEALELPATAEIDAIPETSKEAQLWEI